MKPAISVQVLLQIVLYFSGYYSLLLYLAELLLLCYKGIALPYPARNFWPEVILLFFLGAVDGIRVFLGIKGNLTQRKIPIIISLVLLIPVFIGYLYFTLWQTYVITVELVIMAVGYLGIGLQAVLSPLVLWFLHLQSQIS